MMQDKTKRPNDEEQSPEGKTPNKETSDSDNKELFLGLNLPIELQINILMMLPVKDLVMLCLLAKYYHQLTQDQQIWKNLFQRDFDYDYFALLEHRHNINWHQEYKQQVWKSLFQRDFNYHYPALCLLEQCYSINWHQEYKEAKQNPDWPFPLPPSSMPQYVPPPFTDTDQSEHLQRLYNSMNNIRNVFDSIGQLFPSPSSPPSNQSAPPQTPTLSAAVELKNPQEVIAHLKTGCLPSFEDVLHTCKTDYPFFILELLIAAIPATEIHLIQYALNTACIYNNKMAAAILIARLLSTGQDLNSIVDSNNKAITLVTTTLSNGDLTLLKLLIKSGVSMIAPKNSFLLVYLLSNQLYFDEFAASPLFDNEDFNTPQQYSVTSRFFLPLQLALSMAFTTEINEKLKEQIKKEERTKEEIKKRTKKEIVKKIEWLLEKGASLTDLYQSNASAGMKPCIFFYFECLAVLEKEKFSANTSKTILKALLPHLPDKELKDENGYTILHYAIKILPCDRLQLVMPILLGAGCSVTTTNSSAKTLLHTFLEQHSNEKIDTEFLAILEILLDKISIKSPDINDTAPLDLARKYNLAALIKMIVMRKLDANSCDEQKNNILHLLAEKNKDKDYPDKNIRLLVQLGAQFQQLNTAGKTPLQVAIDNHNPTMVELFISNGALVGKDIIRNDNQHINGLLEIYHSNDEIIDMINTLSISFTKGMVLRFFSDYIVDVKPYINNLVRFNLGRRLLLNDLQSEWDNRNKICLFEYIISSEYLDHEFCRELCVLARQKQSFVLPDEKIRELLELYVKKCENRDKSSADYKDILVEATEMLVRYDQEQKALLTL